MIGLRVLKVACGGTDAADEAALMLSEKLAAAGRSGSALMAGGSFSQMIDDYRAVVQANALRLSTS